MSRSGRFSLTNCNAKAAPPLALRWLEEAQTSGAARHISARGAPADYISPPPGRFPPPCSGLIPAVSGEEGEGSLARLVVPREHPASARTTKNAASQLDHLSARAPLSR